MSGTVAVSREDDVLVLTIDNPPVNALTADVRSGIMRGIAELTADDALRSCVLIGAASTFVGGSDISEFGGPVPDPLLPAVIEAIEQCPKPVVAAIDGYALGGGLELALGCDARVAAPRAQLGLPEVTLGMVPGAGGTQRLPRLTGRVEALRLILSGKTVNAATAATLGIVDQSVDGDLRAHAITTARSAAKRVVAHLPVPDHNGDRDGNLGDVASTLVRGAPRPNVAIAVELVRAAGTIDIAEALRQERAHFDALRTAPDAAALRHVFFAERAAPRRAGVRPEADTLTRVGVIGAGAMGAGIGAAFARAGIGVQLIDADADQAKRGLNRIQAGLDKAVARGLLSADQAAVSFSRCAASQSFAELAGAEIIIEAVVERQDVKVDVLSLAADIAPDATLLTNTSYLKVSDIAAALVDPTRLAGMHFFNPADVMKLVEVISTDHTTPQHLARVLGAAKRLGKIAVWAGDAEGFIGNRVYTAYRRHAEYLLEDGATPAQVDAAMRDFGYAMGPFAVADLSGLQIAQSLRQRWREQGRLPARYVDIPDLLCEQQRWGRRAGRGYYTYDSGQAAADPDVLALIESESARKGISRRTIPPSEIVHRLVGAMAVEGCRVVQEGVARHRDDVDVAMVNGFGFPRHLGGPMWWATTLSPADRALMVSAVAEAGHEDCTASTFETAFNA